MPLKIVGDGPLDGLVREAAARNAVIERLHGVPHDDVYELIGAAAGLILPSQCYEGALPRVVIEAFAKGTPVIVPRHGAMADIVDGRNGACFAAGDANDLAACVRSLWSEASALTEMRRAARETFDRHFTAEANYQALMAVYARAIDQYARHDLSEIEAGSAA